MVEEEGRWLAVSRGVGGWVPPDPPPGGGSPRPFWVQPGKKFEVLFLGEFF